MLDFYRELISPAPFLHISRSILRVNGFLHGSDEQIVVRAVALRQPAGKAMSDDVLERRRGESPVVINEVLAQFGREKQLHQVAPAAIRKSRCRAVLVHASVP